MFVCILHDIHAAYETRVPFRLAGTKFAALYFAVNVNTEQFKEIKTVNNITHTTGALLALSWIGKSIL